MSPRTGTSQIENPICTKRDDLPPAPFAGEGVDPAEPHPDEPGAPPDAPDARRLADEG